jgi:lysophospholipase L1-like esterase
MIFLMFNQLKVLTKSYLLFAIIFLGGCLQTPSYKSGGKDKFVLDYPINRFEDTIKRFEKEDNETVIEKDVVVFYGSSSFAFWRNIKYDLSPIKVLNRGFGGSTIPELIHYASRTILKYQPSKIVIYCGENDLSGGGVVKTPEQVLDSYKELTTIIYKKFPKVKVYFVSMKPSVARKALWPSFVRSNQLIEEYTKKTKNQFYIDISKVMMNEKGEIDGSIFTKDSLHMNPLGYERWTNVIKPILMK